MKKAILRTLIVCVAILAVSCSRYGVYPTKSGKHVHLSGGMVYALPKTVVKVDVTVEKTDYDASPYVEYAEELLGITLDDDEGWTYKIKNVTISTENKPDPEEYYYIEPRWSDLSVQTSPKGLLLSINKEMQPIAPQDKNAEPTERISKINLTEVLYEVAEIEKDAEDDAEDNAEDEEATADQVIAKKRNTMLSKATAAAEAIAEIRMKKKEILYGEYESEYDSKMLANIYSQLDKQEKQYLQLFTGVKTTQREVFYIEPELSKVIVDDQTVELFRFSEDKGIVDSTVVDATPIYCNLQRENNLYTVSRFVKASTQKQAKVAKNGKNNRNKKTKNFKYRLPETVVVNVITPEFTIRQQIKVAQYGPIMELPGKYFQAIFDEKTGELIYYKNNK